MKKRSQSMLSLLGGLLFPLATFATLTDQYQVATYEVRDKGVCTSYNASKTSHFTTLKYRHERGSEESGILEEEESTLAEKVDQALLQSSKKFYLTEMGGENGFLHQMSFNRNASFWEGTCDHWCFWQTEPALLKFINRWDGFLCGETYLDKKDVAEYLTAIYRVETPKEQGFNQDGSFLIGHRTYPYYEVREGQLSDKTLIGFGEEEVERSLNRINHHLMFILDQAGYSNIWPHQADQALVEALGPQERMCILQQDADSSNIWNQPVFKFKRVQVEEIKHQEDLPPISIYYNPLFESYQNLDELSFSKGNYHGITDFYRGEWGVKNKMKLVELIDRFFIEFFISLVKTENVHRLFSRSIYSFLSSFDENLLKSLPRDIVKILKKMDHNKELVDDRMIFEIKQIEKIKEKLFLQIKDKIKLKDDYEMVDIKSNVHYYRETPFRKLGTVKEKDSYHYTILQNRKTKEKISWWRDSKLAHGKRPDYLFRTKKYLEEIRELGRDEYRIKKINQLGMEEKKKASNFIYKVLAGTFINMLMEKCEKIGKK